MFQAICPCSVSNCRPQTRLGHVGGCSLREGGGPRRLRAEPGGRCGEVEPSAPLLASGGEFGSPRPGRRGGLVATAASRSLRHGVEGGHHLLVGTVGGGREMPRAPVRVVLERFGQGAVDCPTRGARRCPVDRGSDERVIQPQRDALDGQQARSFGLVQCVVTAIETVDSVTDRRQPAGIVRRGHEQQPLRAVGQTSVAVEEPALHPTGQRQRDRQGRSPRQLVRVEGCGQFHRASGLPPVAETSRSRTPGSTVTSQRLSRRLSASAPDRPPRVRVGRSVTSKRRASPSRAANSSADPLGLQPASRE